MTQSVVKRGAAAGLVVVALAGFAGCGGGGKPQFCKDRENLQQSIKDLGDLSTLAQGGLSGLQTQLKDIQQQATTLVDSAKSDFPDETAAIQSSVNALVAAIKGLPDNPDPQQIAPLAVDASAAVSAFDAFLKATDEKCK